MTLLSSAIIRRLSNWQRLFLNSCFHSAQRTLPQQCVLCATPGLEQALCTECYSYLPWLDAVRCPQCALPTDEGRLCGVCLADRPRYDRVSAAFAYSWPLAPLIHHYKYGGNLALAPLFARALTRNLASGADLIIPMPLAPARLRRRGFNQGSRAW